MYELMSETRGYKMATNLDADSEVIFKGKELGKEMKTGHCR